MPPEAFEGRTDVRSDLYSLGLTLYELLALKPAFAEKDRHRLIKRVTTKEPARLDKLNRSIPRDLVTIVHKAIDRDPARRYQTAAELTADLQRFLDDEPIHARRVSSLERSWRWCRHHPGVATLTAMLALILVGVTVGSVVVAEEKDAAARNEKNLREQAEQAQKQAEENLKEADWQKKRPEANFAQARKAVEEPFTKVSESQLLQVPGMQPLRRDLLRSALNFFQDFLKERGDDPALRGELAATYLRVGQIHEELGEAEARQTWEQARQLYDALTKAEPKSVEWQHGLAQCYYYLNQDNQAIALWERLVQSDQPRFQKELADAYNRQGQSHADGGRLDRAQEAHQQALALRERLVRLDPDDPIAQHALGQSLNNIGALLVQNRRFADALPLYRRAVEHGEIAWAQAPHVSLHGRFLALCYANIAFAQHRLGRLAEALSAYRRSAEMWRKLARDNPAIPEPHSRLFGAYRDLALCRHELKQTEQAERTMRLAREMIEQLPREGPDELFTLTCVRAQCAAFLAQETGKATAADQAEQKREEDLAMEALNQAIAAGYGNTQAFGSARS